MRFSIKRCIQAGQIVLKFTSAQQSAWKHVSTLLNTTIAWRRFKLLDLTSGFLTQPEQNKNVLLPLKLAPSFWQTSFFV